jgi:hypothetical protein
VLGVGDIFTRNVVNWRRDEVYKLVAQGVLLSPEERGEKS